MEKQRTASMTSLSTPLFPNVHVFTNLEALQTPYYWVFVCRLYHIVKISSLTPLSALVLSQENGDGAENSKFRIMHGVSGDQPLSKSSKSPHRELSHLNKRYSYHPGHDKDFSSSVSGTEVKDQH